MFLLLACTPPAPPPPTKPDVVLVSLDTTRADVVDAETTPNLWALAARGVRFDRAFAHAPTTLSSHASVWTGQDPHGHQVPRNGYPIPPTLPVLPSRMADAGYDTLGVIGASALAEPMGISRGFRVWDEQLSHKHQRRFEARAAEVTDRAIARLAERRAGVPAFLFVHYYDAHAPYDAPAPYETRWSDPAYAGPFDGSRRAMQAIAEASRTGTAAPADVAEVRARYRGEVSYVDAELGRLLATLHDPIVVVFGDHGEALGDVAERAWGHGPDVDVPATHVPLLVAGPGIPAAVVGRPVALSDIGATVLALAGVSGGLGAGRDLAPLWRGGAWADAPIFLEATQPHEMEASAGWNNLPLERGVIHGPWMVLRAPWLSQAASLTRVSDGSVGPDGSPGADVSSVVADLDARLSAWDAAAPPWRGVTMTDETTEGLKALGYLAE